MTGVISDNTGRSSGLVKTASTGAPETGSSNPTVSTNPSAVGDRFVNTTSGEMFIATDITGGANVWKGQLGSEIKPSTAGTGGRGVIGGGQNSATNVIDYVTIATPGNATDFGDLTVARGELGSCSNGSRGLWGGGGTDSTGKTEIDYVTISSLGNATDFGDLVSGRNGVSACSDGTKGVFWHGGQHPTYTNIIEYVNITSTGNTTDFGNLASSDDMQKLGGAVANTTRGILAGGRGGSAGETSGGTIIEYITIASTGNASDFGDLVTGGAALAGVSDGTKGVFGGGYLVSTYGNVLQYLNMASLGNTVDFGDMTVGSAWLAACGNGTRGTWHHGYNPSVGNRNVIDYVTIASLGNATDFGDRTISNYGQAGCAGD